MSIAERRCREKQALRENILNTAWQIVRDEGWQSLSIRKIADAIEYSVPVIYDHFENKEAILMEFGKQGFELIIKKMLAAKNQTRDPEEQLKAIANAYWSFAFKHKEYYQLMWGMNIPCCGMERCIPERFDFKDLIMGPMNSIIERSNNQTVKACIKYHTFWSILHGLISIKMIAPPDDSLEVNKMVMEDAIEGFIKNLSS
ncbi:TetR family transcriptional regulator [Anseongella ginsenosidimutans]|uniref:TetR family transcriptional regulator n=1 Tax=Anseongella ginsenosidimutans TaxID=496056 RepID=A0A4R3KUJ2_9SPHI|nr:TetR/AcrR family transcriptional regulator [Anseongella ginsenosidimutans]QEC51726.1 TetR/AcrR family transcriptional regulator [Anseongella ginsenosidimutans]TCS89089.1 TetR family transcriptional regulator [Anseongella ginsenosidimutans]